MHPILTAAAMVILLAGGAAAEAGPSGDTQACVECHKHLHPGIVAEWHKSRHGKTTPASAVVKPVIERRVSSGDIPETLAGVSVGCAECHTMRSDAHPDSFDHNGYKVHTVVTPGDCAVCHAKEAEQYGGNLMAHAYGNLVENPVYRDLMDNINAVSVIEGDGMKTNPPAAESHADSCLFCHGTKVTVAGKRTVASDFGDMEVPVLSGWPNQGVGRINPDGTKGACSACHTRHQFSIVMARKPHTCAECHKGPDVPAYAVYQVSKHGGIYSAKQGDWDFDAVPWTVGKDLTGPTCATCHVSLLAGPEGEVLAERTHRMNERLPHRIFGLVYSHPHPISADTTIIRNAAGLPLPTELTGEPAAAFLISKEEQGVRLAKMQKTCLGCHSSGWVTGHFNRLEESLKTTDAMTLAATNILLSARKKGLAKGLDKGDSPFNESIEKMWVEQWLFYANSTRFASAMAGADYGAFANGRWYLSKNLRDMFERVAAVPETAP